MSDLSDLAVACNKILTLEKAFGENRFVRALPFRQIKLTAKSKFELQTIFKKQEERTMLICPFPFILFKNIALSRKLVYLNFPRKKLTLTV